ncbi:MAG TPA: DNA primase small subunit domain-containing protein [Actinomycetota bacterium]|nr:DNA primase small subunit domain-containing protein [Actinomycetota bacterium]
MATPFEMVEAAGRAVKVSNPGKTFFPRAGVSKLDLVHYYLAVADGVLNGCCGRPTSLYRWPNGVDSPDDAFFQKRVPSARPEWLRTHVVSFPSGRTADMLVVADAAHLVWMLNLGCIDVNPWPVRAPLSPPPPCASRASSPSADGDHPDELRVDLDPTPGIPFEDVRRVAPVVRDVLREHGLEGWPKTSGKRGMHVYVRIEPRWDFTEVRRAALALAREVERRMPGVATTKWWKEERRGVFVDYNQNARDRTIASAYSVRPVADARVSCPLAWDEVPDVEPAELTVATVPARVARDGDPWRGMDDASAGIESLLELARRDEREGLGDAPWPPHFPKARGEPPRAAPSRRRDLR